MTSNQPAEERLTSALSDRYRIESEIGAGGMATVYLAQDLKHDRKVAVKVLKPELAAVLGAERFLSEIKTTANLQHPHILPLFDSGEADGFLFYVMPFVEGESLRAKLDREKQLSVDEAVGIARSVASALDYAHRHGVIHRDIKPANILLHDGQPMVADFGIALAVRAAGGERLTETGLSLGTPQYMSPEQAAGDREVDGRSDLYSLGSVLYEMLTGEPPHSGPTVQAIIAKLLTDKPRPVTELRETVPVYVAAVVHKALAKLPADRFGGAEEMAESLWGRGPSLAVDIGASPSREGKRVAFGLRLLPWAFVLVLATLLLAQRLGEGARPASPQIDYLNIQLDDSIPLAFIGEAWAGIALSAMDLSPDGRTLVYVGQVGETTQLFVRSLDGFETRALPGTQDALDPVFSPDGKRVAFTANNRLHQVAIGGGPVTSITEAYQPYGTSWNEDGRIVSVTQDARTLLVTGPSGNDAETTPVGGSLGTYMAEPQWIPDSEWFLATCYNPFVLCAYSAETLEVRMLVANGEAGDPNGTPLRGTNPRFVKPEYLIFSAPGHNTLMGVRFDPTRLAVLGDPVELLSGIRRESMHGVLQLAVSESGDLLYAPGEDGVQAYLVWAEPNQVRDTLPFDPQIYGGYYLSPDEREIAARVTSETGEFELYFLDLVRGVSNRWRREGSYAEGILYYGGWLPDSRSAVVTIVKGDSSKLVRIDAQSSTGGVTLWEGKGVVAGQSFEEDGTGIFTVYHPEEGSYASEVSLSDLPNLPHDALEAFPPVFERGGLEAFLSRSPDGEWEIFNSDSEGQWELEARRAGTDDFIKISTNGADIGRWTTRGDGLYFRNGQSFYWVGLTGNPDNPFTQPEFYLGGNFLNVPGPELSVNSDGRRLLLLEGPPARTTTRLNYIKNWKQILEERMGRGS